MVERVWAVGGLGEQALVCCRSSIKLCNLPRQVLPKLAMLHGINADTTPKRDQSVCDRSPSNSKLFLFWDSLYTLKTLYPGL